VVPTRLYELADAAEVLAANGIDLDKVAAVEGRIMSAFVRATKAEAGDVSGPAGD